jgi:GntR family transcriptional regulator
MFRGSDCARPRSGYHGTFCAVSGENDALARPVVMSLHFSMAWDAHDLEPGPLPLWAQIAGRLREAIAAGAFAPGDALPGEAELGRRFVVSRSTARSALDRLENEGHIVRRAGKGSIVLPPRIERPLNRLSSFAEDMRARGLRASYATRAVHTLPAPKEVAIALQIDPGTPVVTIDRLFLANERPIAVSVTRLAPILFQHSPAPTRRELDTGSLYAWIESRTGLRIAGGGETIHAASATPSIARRLELQPLGPVLVSRRISFTADRRPIEHVVMRYRADRYQLQVELIRP